MLINLSQRYHFFFFLIIKKKKNPFGKKKRFWPEIAFSFKVRLVASDSVGRSV